MPDPKHEDAVMPYNPDENPASAVESVLMQHRHALLGQPGVTGVAVGKSPTGDDAIVIYLLDNSYGLPGQGTGPQRPQRGRAGSARFTISIFPSMGRR